jgi:D-alanine-D-alanine ligase-like ATP-grasp enzyme
MLPLKVSSTCKVWHSPYTTEALVILPLKLSSTCKKCGILHTRSRHSWSYLSSCHLRAKSVAFSIHDRGTRDLTSQVVIYVQKVWHSPYTIKALVILPLKLSSTRKKCGILHTRSRHSWSCLSSCHLRAKSVAFSIHDRGNRDLTSQVVIYVQKVWHSPYTIEALVILPLKLSSMCKQCGILHTRSKHSWSYLSRCLLDSFHTISELPFELKGGGVYAPQWRKL